MNCISCNKEINSKSTKNICLDCRFDPDVMISYTDVKKKYKLTDDEIDSTKLFFVQFKIHGNIGTKYLRSEIEHLADELTKDLDPYNKKRQAYLKQKELIDEIKKKEEEYINMKKKIKEDVLELVKKYDVVVDDVTKCYVDELFEDINVTKEKNRNTMRIVEKVGKWYRKKELKIKKKNKIEKQIKKKIKKKYHQYAFDHNAYQQYINLKIKTATDAIEIINKDLQFKIEKDRKDKKMQIEREKREKKIKEKIEEQIKKNTIN